MLLDDWSMTRQRFWVPCMQASADLALACMGSAWMGQRAQACRARRPLWPGPHQFGCMGVHDTLHELVTGLVAPIWHGPLPTCHAQAVGAQAQRPALPSPLDITHYKL